MKTTMKIPALSVLNLLLSVFAHQSHVLAQGTTSNAECERGTYNYSYGRQLASQMM